MRTTNPEYRPPVTPQDIGALRVEHAESSVSFADAVETSGMGGDDIKGKDESIGLL